MKLRALCLAGPTASGKSALAMALAEQLPLEIISVDSALVYRSMDIGTAKPSDAERAAVPHHLIDILDPLQAYSAARFVADARRLIDEIHARGRLPLLVGGTMLYYKALREGLDEMPPADPTVRAALDQQAAERGWPALHAELALVDPATAARLPLRPSADASSENAANSGTICIADECRPGDPSRNTAWTKTCASAARAIGVLRDSSTCSAAVR